jgi:DNA (cytosine-5)-methyltransferase 1
MVEPPPTFDIMDLFAGIGGTRLAFERAGGRCVFSSEWNRFACQTYEANFGEVPHGDITQIPSGEIPAHDVLVAGFPCQPFSIAGVSKHRALGNPDGFLHRTQGTLFFEVARILRDRRPRAFLLENVRNLISHDGGRTFSTILNVLQQDLGYKVSYDVIDGAQVVPQHRERTYIVGFLDHSVEFSFPAFPERTIRLADILEPEPPAKYVLTQHLWQYLQDYAKKHRARGNGFGYGLVDPNKESAVTRTLSARYYKDGSEILIPTEDGRPRRLTPRECARLMGFPESFQIPVSDTQAYHQFGNSVVVPVVEAVAKAIQECLTSGFVKQASRPKRPDQLPLLYASGVQTVSQTTPGVGKAMAGAR